MIIDAKNMPYAELNKMIRDSDEQKFTLRTFSVRDTSARVFPARRYS